jgi:hypothetical protein
VLSKIVKVSGTARLVGAARPGSAVAVTSVAFCHLLPKNARINAIVP